tara:strand:- start:7897 stop:8823 length:927 start_codon:yes stop_codon:yes gene_type:complete
MSIKFLISKLFKIPENSVIIVYQGGLGNQLFQYFLGNELQKKFNKNVFYYDLRNSYRTNHNSDLENLFYLNLRKYNIENLNLILRFIFLSPISLKTYRYLFNKFKIKIFSNFYFDSINTNINLNDINFNNNILVFFGTWHKLINQYEFLPSCKNLKYKEDINITKKLNLNKKFISLHVRRGDYINYRASKFHGNLDISYYLKGINFLRSKFGNLSVFLFSDDPKWVQNNLVNLIPNSTVISSGNFSAESEFIIMSKANYFILSNSTYSWLSAFFSKNEDKFIIIPKFWFKSYQVTSEYIFKDWQYKII